MNVAKAAVVFRLQLRELMMGTVATRLSSPHTPTLSCPLHIAVIAFVVKCSSSTAFITTSSRVLNGQGHCTHSSALSCLPYSFPSVCCACRRAPAAVAPNTPTNMASAIGSCTLLCIHWSALTPLTVFLSWLIIGRLPQTGRPRRQTQLTMPGPGSNPSPPRRHPHPCVDGIEPDPVPLSSSPNLTLLTLLPRLPRQQLLVPVLPRHVPLPDPRRLRLAPTLFCDSDTTAQHA